jgi:hypothetical protein
MDFRAQTRQVLGIRFSRWCQSRIKGAGVKNQGSLLILLFGLSMGKKEIRRADSNRLPLLITRKVGDVADSFPSREIALRMRITTLPCFLLLVTVECGLASNCRRWLTVSRGTTTQTPRDDEDRSRTCPPRGERKRRSARERSGSISAHLSRTRPRRRKRPHPPVCM